MSRENVGMPGSERLRKEIEDGVDHPLPFPSRVDHIPVTRSFDDRDLKLVACRFQRFREIRCERSGNRSVHCTVQKMNRQVRAALHV